MSKIIQIFLIAFLGLSLSGCIAAAVGAGAAGGYYFEKNYKVEKKTEKDKTAKKKEKETKDKQ